MRIIHRNTTPSLASEPAQTSLGRHVLGAVTGGPDRKSSGLHSPSLLLKKRLALPIFALLAALAVGLLFLLPGGLLQAQESATIMYPENGTEPVATFTAVDPEGADVVWTLVGDDADGFEIEGGVLTFAKSPDFEGATGGGQNGNSNTYNVTVQASDGRATDAKQSTQPIMVMVTNVDEPGKVILPTLQPVDGIELVATHTDPDDGMTGEEWQWATSTDGSTYTDIVQEGTKVDATTAAYRPVSGDVGKFLRATVTYRDNQGANKTAQVVSAHAVLAARSTNTPPVFKDADDTEIPLGDLVEREVAENTPAGEPVGDPVVAADAEGDVLTYSLRDTGDDDSFAIDRATGQLWTKSPLDVETKATYMVEVTATDPSFNGEDDDDMIMVTIMVTNVQEPPKITAGAAAISHPENGTELDTDVYTDGIQSATYTAEDDEDGDGDGNGDRPTLTLLGADSGKFTFTSPDGSGSGTLAFKAEPNFESPGDANQDNAYEVTVVATDNNGQTASRDVTVRVTNVEEDGTVTLSSVQPRVAVSITASVTDLDGAPTDVEWQWSRSGSESGVECTDLQIMDGILTCYAPIKDATSATYTPVETDATAVEDGMYLKATATYTDPQGPDTAEKSSGANAVQIDARNRPPKFPDQDDKTPGDQLDQAREVAENVANAPVVVNVADTDAETGDPVTAMDPNGEKDNITYTLGGADAASFTIDAQTGQLMAIGMLNREVKDTYTVTVTATDSYQESATITVTIKVANTEEDPKVSGDATANYPENGTGLVKSYRATDDEDDQTRTALKWSLGRTADEGDFSLDNGVLTFKKSPNFEEPTGGSNDDTNTYTVEVIVTDSSAMTHMLTVVVTVTDVDEPGTVTLSTLQPVDGVEITAVLADIDRGPQNDMAPDNVMWKWAKSNSSSSCNVTDVAPTASTYIPGGDAVGMYVCVVVTYGDAEGGDKTLQAVSTARVLATRSSNVKPEFENAEGDEIDDVTREVPENTAARRPVGARIVAKDPDNDTLTYTLSGDHAASFTINAETGQLMTKVPLDKEMRDSYMVDVTATDPYFVTSTSDRGADTIAVTITVTDVAEDPEVTGDASRDYAENAVAPVETYVGADDEDGVDIPVTFSLEGTDAGKFGISNAADDRGQLAFKTSPDFEARGDANRDNAYQVTVVVTDSKNQTDRLNVTVTVTNVEEPGTVTLSSVQPRIGVPLTATLTDLDGTPTDVKWQWTASNNNIPDGTWTNIEDATSATYTPSTKDPTNAELYLRATASYTDPQASGKSMSATSANMVELDTQNKVPKFPDQDMETDGDQLDQTRNVDENTVSPGIVGALVTATDDNIEDLLTYTLGGGDAALFSIDRPSGQIMVGSGTKLDYETKDTYTVTVTATDSYQASATITVTIKVNNVDEAPAISRGGLAISGNSNIRYEENASGAVETYRASGPESANAIWSLSGDDDAYLMISGGMLTFRNSPDYENPTDMGMDNVYMVTIMADDETYMAMRNVTVTVTNLDEMGEVTLWAGTEALTMAPQVGDTITGDVMDPDGGETVESWQWSRTMDTADMNSWMDIQDATDAAYMVTADDTGYHLRVMATYTDAAGTDMAMEYSPATMMVTAMMTVPMFDSETATREVAENTEASMDIGDPVMGTDADGDTLIYALGGTDAGSFYIDPETGQLKTLAALDYETKATYSVMVTATDPDSTSDMITVTITVTNLDEMGEVTLWAGTEALTMAPQVGDTITGAVMDPDGGETVESWQWSRTMDTADMNSWMDIQDATDAAYMVTADDTGYHLRVMATYTDAAGTDMAMEYSPATMMVTAMMTVPMFDSETATREVAENTEASMDIGDPVMGTDADGDRLIYALGGTDAASFYIDPETGQLKTLAALDYETKATYEVMVTATDPDSASDMITVTITVTNVDEMGEVTLWAGTDALTMAPQVGDTITGAVMDSDGDVTGESWQWAKTKTPAMMDSWMPITGATGAAYMVTEGDTGYYLRVMATYTDAAGTDTAMEYSMPTMIVGAEAGDTLLDRYDANNNEQIDRPEVLDAIRDFVFNQTIERDDVVDVIRLFVFSR